MRVIGFRFDVQLSMPNGIKFKGILPEAITSQIWKHGCYDPKTTLKLIKLLEKGNTFLDIGAHFGYFMLIGQSLVSSSGKVIASLNGGFSPRSHYRTKEQGQYCR